MWLVAGKLVMWHITAILWRKNVVRPTLYFFLIRFCCCFNQAKLRLEMAAEHDKHVAQKEMEAKDEEIEQLRSNMQKKV